MSEEPHTINDILDSLQSLSKDGEQVSLEQAIGAFGHRSYGPFLIIPALIEISPIGGIPGVPTVLAAIIALFAIQIIFGRRHIWLPEILGRRAVGSDKVGKATEKLRGFAKVVDRLFHGRLERLTRGVFVQLAAVATIILACTVPPLEILPFASTVPMLAIVAFGVALLVRDGALMLAGYAIAIAAVAIGVGMLGSQS